jgi:hypothetical protein
MSHDLNFLNLLCLHQFSLLTVPKTGVPFPLGLRSELSPTLANLPIRHSLYNESLYAPQEGVLVTMSPEANCCQTSIFLYNFSQMIAWKRCSLFFCSCTLNLMSINDHCLCHNTCVTYGTCLQYVLHCFVWSQVLMGCNILYQIPPISNYYCNSSGGGPVICGPYSSLSFQRGILTFINAEICLHFLYLTHSSLAQSSTSQLQQILMQICLRLHLSILLNCVDM